MELGDRDASGRRSPVDTGRTVEVPADTVITAVGEHVDDALFAANGVALDKKGRPVVNETMATGCGQRVRRGRRPPGAPPLWWRPLPTPPPPPRPSPA